MKGSIGVRRVLSTCDRSFVKTRALVPSQRSRSRSPDASRRYDIVIWNVSFAVRPAGFSRTHWVTAHPHRQRAGRGWSYVQYPSMTAGLLIRSQRLSYVKLADFSPSSAGRAASREEGEEWSESSGESSVSHLASCSPFNIFQDDDKTRDRDGCFNGLMIRAASSRGLQTYFWVAT